MMEEELPRLSIPIIQKEIRKRIITLNDLARVWTNQRKKGQFVRDLIEKSISPKTLSALFEAPDSDPFDIIAHVAFGTPLISIPLLKL
jgi:type I restriction enzyme R subunit